MKSYLCLCFLLFSLFSLSPAVSSGNEAETRSAAAWPTATTLCEAGDHFWDGGTILLQPSCTEEGLAEFRCEICGESEHRTIPAQGHIAREVMSCTEDQICIYCGTVVSHGHDHAYQKEEIAPTETERGYTVYTCTECWDRYLADVTKPIGGAAHRYQTDVSVPSCTEGGYVTHTCSDCGDSYSVRYAEPAGHHWDAGRVIAAPSFTENGIKEYTCQTCGEVSVAVIPALSFPEEPR